MRDDVERWFIDEFKQGWKCCSALPRIWGRTPEEARDTMELAQQVVSLPHATKRDLLALVKKMVALERPQTGRRPKLKGRRKSIFRGLALAVKRQIWRRPHRHRRTPDVVGTGRCAAMQKVVLLARLAHRWGASLFIRAATPGKCRRSLRNLSS